MDTYLVNNIEKKLVDTILPSLSVARDVRIAVAFLQQAGLALIEDALVRCLKKGGMVEFIVGLDFRITGADALITLKEMGEEYEKLRLYCFSSPLTDDMPFYHPKLYIFTGMSKATVIIGSSNLTKGGLMNNIEVNVVLEVSEQDEFLSDVYGLYGGLKFQPSRFEPDLEFLRDYARVTERVRVGEREALKQKQFKSLMTELTKKESEMLRPKAKPQDLFGWQRIVYDRLPLRAFRTRDMYTYEKEFQRYYPENRNVRAKVRQILQQLRDMDLIRSPQRDKWLRI